MLTSTFLNIIALLVFYLTLRVKISFFGILTDFIFIALIFFLINLVKNVRVKKISYTVFVVLILFAFDLLLSVQIVCFTFKFDVC